MSTNDERDDRVSDRNSDDRTEFDGKRDEFVGRPASDARGDETDPRNLDAAGGRDWSRKGGRSDDGAAAPSSPGFAASRNDGAAGSRRVSYGRDAAGYGSARAGGVDDQRTVPQPTSPQPSSPGASGDDAWRGSGHHGDSASHSGVAFGGATGAPLGGGGAHPGPAGGAEYRGGFEGAPGSSTMTAEQPKKRGGRVTGIAATALVIGALVGGAAGAGTTALVNQNANSNQKVVTSKAQNIQVNNPTNATAVTAAAAKATPSVVTVSVKGTASGQQASGTGSGIIYSSDGYIVTNNHVATVDGTVSNPSISVTTSDGSIYQAKLVATDPLADIAVIKINTSGLTAATFANSSKLNVGDVAIAIGAPLGLSGTVTDGIVSSLNRSIQVQSSAAPDTQDRSDSGNNTWNFQNPNGSGQQQQQSSSNTIQLSVIQTDAAINPGNSGGALVDDSGAVIGMNVAIASTSSSDSSSGSQSGNIGVGFAIPANYVHQIAKELIADGSAKHGMIGASVSDSSDSSAAQVAGALIRKVTSGGPAEKAGLAEGDIITKINGVTVSSASDLIAQVRMLTPNESVTVEYSRSGTQNSTKITIGTLQST